MQDFINYFTRVENIVSLSQFLFFGIITLLLFKRTGNVKVLEKFFRSDIFNNFLGGVEMADTKNVKAVKSAGQTFDKMQKVYRLNKATGELEDTGERVDMQEFINSGVSSCLTEVLSRFFPDNVPKSEEVIELNNLGDDIDSLNEAFMVADSYREVLGLSADASMTDIFNAMSTKSAELKDKLSKATVKEVKQDEKETIKESE